MKILIITAFFPPQNSIASLRPYTWAKYWSRMGHEVTVLTTPKGPSPSNSPKDCSEFTVVERPLAVYDTLRRWLRSAPAPTAQTSAQAPASVASTNRPGLKARLRTWVNGLQQRYGFFYGCRMPDMLDFWSDAAFEMGRQSQWDLVVSTAGPYAVHRPAARLHRQGYARLWIADWRDLWVDNHIFPGLPFLRWLERRLERRWCLQADCVTSISEPFADTLRAKYGSKVQVVYNGFDPDDYAHLPIEPAFADDGIFRVVYTGTIYPGKQDPGPFFAAVAALEQQGLVHPSRFQILFCGNNANVDDIAQQFGVGAYVQYLGFVPHAKALHMQRDASLLLFLDFQSDTTTGVLTGKVFEYLYIGRQIFASGVQPNTPVRSLLDQATKAYVSEGQAQADQDYLRHAIAQPPGRPTPEQAAQVMSEIGFYTRENQARVMLGLLNPQTAKV